MIEYVERFRTAIFYVFATSVCTSEYASVDIRSSFLRLLRAFFSTPDLLNIRSFATVSHGLSQSVSFQRHHAPNPASKQALCDDHFPS